ncbi:hypothetical protein ABT147_17945 [Streptomyces sp. NPDC001868]|uniref:hypothetical protein n=1 Tax=Streptomyces sp. NPDC001868 TaxID=3154401 RepID=UPI00332C272B
MVLALCSLAGCGNGDEKASAAGVGKSTPTATAEATKGPGDYRPPTDLRSALDFGPPADAIAPNDGPPKGKRTGADPATGSGAACLQPFGKTGSTAQGRTVVYCTAWKNVTTAVKHYEYMERSVSKAAQGPVAQVPDLGDGAFRQESVEEAAVFPSDLRLVVRDSNLECEVQVQSKTLLTDQQVIAAWPSMGGEIVQALLPELRS